MAYRVMTFRHDAEGKELPAGRPFDISETAYRAFMANPKLWLGGWAVDGPLKGAWLRITDDDGRTVSEGLLAAGEFPGLASRNALMTAK